MNLKDNNYMNLKDLEKRMAERSFFEKHIKYLPLRIWGRIEDIILAIKFAWQRVFRGYDDRAYWSLCDYLAEIALPILKDYREETEMKGVPNGLSCEEWDAKLDTMIKAFDLIIKDDITAENWEEDHKKINEGLKEFGDYYQSLWS